MNSLAFATSQWTLSQVPFPMPGEHIAGYVRRLVQANRLPALRPAAKLLGIRDITPRSVDATWSVLAEVLGVSPSFVEPLRWRTLPDCARGWVSFLGHEVHESYLHHRRMRLCRPCVTNSGTLLSLWSLKQVTACSIHRLRLVEACPGCGTLLNFSSHQCWTCNLCGADCREGPDQSASAEEMLIAGALATKITGTPLPSQAPSRLPQEWGSLALQEQLTTLEYLGRLVQLDSADAVPKHLKRSFATITLKPNETTADHRRRLTIAAQILTNWPSAYHAILNNLVDRNPSPTASAPLLRRFSTTAGAFAIRALKDRTAEDFSLLTDARHNFLVERIGYRRGARVVRRRAIDGQFANLDLISKEAALRLLAEGQYRSLAPWIEAGLITPVRVAGRTRASRLDEVERVRAEFQSLPDPPTGNLRLMHGVEAFATQGRSKMYRPASLLTHILSGVLPAYSSGPTLAEIVFERAHFEYLMSIHVLGHWVRHHIYVTIQRFNKHAARLWGPMGIYDVRECMRLVAADELRFRYSAYRIRGWQQPLFNVADLIRDVQASCHPHHFDLDDPEDPLRFEESAIR